MVFTREEKNGVRDLEPADAKRRDDALTLYNACAHLARHVCHDADAHESEQAWALRVPVHERSLEPVSASYAGNLTGNLFDGGPLAWPH